LCSLARVNGKDIFSAIKEIESDINLNDIGECINNRWTNLDAKFHKPHPSIKQMAEEVSNLKELRNRPAHVSPTERWRINSLSRRIQKRV